MTTTSPTLTDSRPTDIRDVFARAVATAGEVIGRVRPDQLGDPTPCDELDVRALLGHLVTVLERVAILGRGENPFALTDTSIGLADDAWPAAWADAAQRVEEAWADDATLDRTVVLPWARQSGARTLASYCSEITVHTWDLARATGQRPAWDREVLQAAWEGSQILPAQGRAELFASIRAGMPEPYRNGPDPYGDPVPVPDDAPLIDRLVAWNGRRP